MSKPANKTLIGTFVIGAIALLVIAILIFGSGKFLKKKFNAVVFFEGSIKGLNEGASVIFKGVKIGSVTNIRLIYDPEDASLRLPVIIELEPEKIERTDSGVRKPKEGLKLLIERGLRAQLQMQSIVTGQLMIALDFFPDKPAKYVSFLKDYIEIPSVPTPFEELTTTIHKLPFKEIVNKVDLTLDSVRKLIENLDNQMKPFISNISKTSQAAQNTLEEVQGLLKNVKNKIEPIISNLSNTIQVAHDTLGSTQSALNQTEKMLHTFSSDSKLIYELNKMFEELSSAARSVRHLTEYLEQHPDSLIKGKPE